MTDAATLRNDPAPALVATFTAAAARMDGLPFVNPRLRPEAVRFAAWEGHWLGVLVTPWFMNLVLAPRDPAAWTPLRIGAKRRFAFPAGDYDFIGAVDPACGEFAMCSLFSPVQEFADHAQAVAVATHALAALFDPRNASDDPVPAAHAAPPPPSPAAARLAAPLSRRELLRGRFLDRDA
ncbi:MAG: [NiFe]-hydrogenase assembly chaperone HybE [Burkholderiales bacterium]